MAVDDKSKQKSLHMYEISNHIIQLRTLTKLLVDIIIDIRFAN